MESPSTTVAAAEELPAELELKDPAFAAFLAWLIPGLGHWYQGRTGKGILYFLCIVPLFFFGFQQGGYQNVYFRWDNEEWSYPYLAQVGMGAVVLPALVRNPAWRAWLPESIRGFELPPDNQERDLIHRRYGKRVDIALVYTMIAGLLNFFAVYDAFAGPAMYDEERKMLAKRRGKGKGPEGKPTGDDASQASNDAPQASSGASLVSSDAPPAAETQS